MRKPFVLLSLIILLSSQFSIQEEILFDIINPIENLNDDFLVDVPIATNPYNRLQLLVPVEIGTPAQRFRVLIDTGSFTLWVHHKRANKSRLNTFDPTRSNTYFSTGIQDQITYVTGYTQGFIVNEKVSLHGMGKVDLSFLLADASDVSDYDGILGMGYSYTNGRFRKSSDAIMEKMREVGHINQNLFTQHVNGDGKGVLAVGDYPDVVKRRIGSEGHNHFIKGCTAVKGSSHWMCKATKLTMDNSDKSFTFPYYEDEVVFDTGATANLLSKGNFEKITNLFFGREISNGQCFVYPIQTGLNGLLCSPSVFKTLQPIRIHFGTEHILVEPSTYFSPGIRIGGETKYLFDFLMPTSGFGDNLLGMKTLEKYILIFNKDSNRMEFTPNPEQVDIKKYEDSINQPIKPKPIEPKQIEPSMPKPSEPIPADPIRPKPIDPLKPKPSDQTSPTDINGFMQDDYLDYLVSIVQSSSKSRDYDKGNIKRLVDIYKNNKKALLIVTGLQATQGLIKSLRDIEKMINEILTRSGLN